MPIIETMSLQETVDALHELGIRTSKETLSYGIEQGCYPWAICIRCAKQRRFEIYAKPFREWVAALSKEVDL